MASLDRSRTRQERRLRLGAGAQERYALQTGEWHNTFSSEFVEQKRGEGAWLGDSRKMEEWPRPPELSPGFTLALRVIVPSGAVCVPCSSLSSKLVALAPPPPDRAREIVICFTKPGAKVSGWPGRRSMGTQLVGSFQNEAGETVWVVEQEVDPVTLQNAELSGPRAFRPDVSGIDENSLLRGLFFGVHEDGSRWVFEARLDASEDPREIAKKLARRG